MDLGQEQAKQYRYASHTFADKRKMAHLQAADVYAYEWCKQAKSQFGLDRRKMRKSLEALVTGNANHRYLHQSSQLLRKIFEESIRSHGWELARFGMT